jgi:hypothetical protein
METRQRRSFTDDCKWQAVDLVASSGRYPHKTALDADSAVMIEDDKGPAMRDVGGVIGLTLRLKPLDLK